MSPTRAAGMPMIHLLRFVPPEFAEPCSPARFCELRRNGPPKPDHELGFRLRPAVAAVGHVLAQGYEAAVFLGGLRRFVEYRGKQDRASDPLGSQVFGRRDGRDAGRAEAAA